MDPIANLREQVQLAAALNRIRDRVDPETGIILADDLDEFEQSAFRLAELVEALDEWRQKGGFDPYTAAVA